MRRTHKYLFEEKEVSETRLKHSHCIDDRNRRGCFGGGVCVYVNNDNFDGERTEISLFDDEVGVFE